MAHGFQVTFDAADPDKLAAFWAEALGYQLQPPPDGYDSWEDFVADKDIPESDWGKYSAIVDPDGIGPRVFIQRVPEPKTVKNRVHLDVNVAAAADPDERRGVVEEAVERLEGLGATRVAEYTEYGSHWVVMQDPEGNEFCVQ